MSQLEEDEPGIEEALPVKWKLCECPPRKEGLSSAVKSIVLEVPKELSYTPGINKLFLKP